VFNYIIILMSTRLKYKDTSNTISHIYKNIYLSNYKNAENINRLNEHNIGAILYIGNRPKSPNIKQLYINNNINHRFIHMNDSIYANISECFEPSWKFITKNAEQDRNILVHCHKGISRSPTIVAYYLMRILYEYKFKHHNKIQPVLNEILDLIHLYRPCANPNINFILQLKMYESKILQV
jgi:protein tyrosine phosphatase